MQLLSDYHFHKSENKKAAYFANSNPWWSNELKKWMCTNPKLIKSVLADDRFTVHSYQVKPLEEKTHTNFTYISAIVDYFPLALEATAHKEMRKRDAQKLGERVGSTLNLLKSEVGANIQALKQTTQDINLYAELIEPNVRRALLHLADLDSLANHPIISISQLFDQAISIRKRIGINNQIAELLQLLPAELSDDDKYFRLSMFAVGYDSLLGSITESLVRTLLLNKNKRINEIKWSEELPNTGVPVIERVAKYDAELGNMVIKKGQRIRLYLESAGFAKTEDSLYSSLFFGNGIHKCIGQHLSKAVWQIFVQELVQIDRHFEIKSLHYRTEDYVFNIFDEIKVFFYD